MSNSLKFKAIGFDWGGVIYGRSGTDFSSALSKLLGVSLATFYKVYFKHNSLINLTRISADSFWNIVLTELGVEDKLQQTLDFVNSQPPRKINQDMIELIKTLRTTGFKTGLLSNSSPQGALEIKQKGIDQYFDVVMVSSDIGHMKPSLEAYLLFTKELCIKPDELIFIDDTKKSLSTAKKLGYYPILFTNYSHLILQLKQLGVY